MTLLGDFGLVFILFIFTASVTTLINKSNINHFRPSIFNRIRLDVNKLDLLQSASNYFHSCLTYISLLTCSSSLPRNLSMFDIYIIYLLACSNPLRNSSMFDLHIPAHVLQSASKSFHVSWCLTCIISIARILVSTFPSPRVSFGLIRSVLKWYPAGTRCKQALASERRVSK